MATQTKADPSVASATASVDEQSHEHELHELSIVDKVARALVARHLTDEEASPLYDTHEDDHESS